MRIPVERSLCQPVIIGDSATFNGWLEDGSGYFSDASLYDADDGNEDELFEVAQNSRDLKVCNDRKLKLSTKPTTEVTPLVGDSDLTSGTAASSTSRTIVKAFHKPKKDANVWSETSDNTKTCTASLYDHEKVQEAEADCVAIVEKSTDKKRHLRKLKFAEEDSSASDAEAKHLSDFDVQHKMKFTTPPDEGVKTKIQSFTAKFINRKLKKNGLSEIHNSVENAGSASSHDSEVEVNTQGKLVTTVDISGDVKSKKKAIAKMVGRHVVKTDAQEFKESKSRKAKLVDATFLPSKAFQKEKRHVAARMEENKSFLEVVHIARTSNIANPVVLEKKRKFLRKSQLKQFTEMKDPDASRLVGSQVKILEVEASGKTEVTRADDESSSLTKYLMEGAKRQSTVQKICNGATDLRKGTKSTHNQDGRSIRGFSAKYTTSKGPAAACFQNVRAAITKDLSITTAHQSDLLKGQVTKDVCASLESVHSAVDHQQPHAEKDFDNGAAGEEVSSGVTEGGEENECKKAEDKGDETSKVEAAVMDVGWVLCDDCHKWRCIPSTLADAIEATNCRWSCKENPNKDFADCTIPQEKSNAEINAELNISEVSFCEDDDEEDVSIDSKHSNGPKFQGQPQAAWTLVKHNIFQHRERKIQTIDEIMVCGCVPPEDGGPGCRDDCLNRMLSIECIPETCPCGDLCSNQQFQKRSYAKVGWFRCGKKGFGLQILEDVSEGTFIIEYVGEVLDMIAYEARQRDYALRGQKHFYFMTLNSTEVIDACYKGNLGRFINHSCEPNCKTEKWMINGEVCIGLFAIKDLKKGEEITFDYNFVRVCGAAAKKCLCGSIECRGFIGGDPMTPCSIVESESDEEDPEPIMLEESYCEEEEAQHEIRKPLTEKGTHGKSGLSSHRMAAGKRKWMFDENDEKLGASSKRVKTHTKLRKLDITNAKRLTVQTVGVRFDGVEEKLNEMLDENGGLCKRQYAPKDIATQYLKLLLVTAATGDAVNGEMSTSTRDLSIVLDALLKTLSRSILTEIMNKNGLHVLHNMIKQFRRNFQKTPIIRKLLKVLEFLASKNILTSEQLNAAPHHDEAESVNETIRQLCWHDDSEVQRIARRFKQKFHWIVGHKPFKRQKGFLSPDLDQHRSRLNQYQDSEIIGDAMFKRQTQAPSNELAIKHNRPSRWDQPSQEVLDTTLAGGLPQSFWPFNASNLLGGKSHQDLSDSAPRCTGTATADEFGRMHPRPPTFPAFELQQPSATAKTEVNMPSVVSGISVGQFSTSSSMGFIPQQMSVCVGIPVTQFQAAHRVGGSDSTYFSQQHAPWNGSNESQLASHSSSRESQAREPCKGVLPPTQASNITFGVSPSQFFQQMHGLFGSAFHPWQLQALLAPHSWGPFLAGDARLDDFNRTKQFDAGLLPSGCNTPCKSVAEQPNEAVELELEPEPPVPGLSPPQCTGPVVQQYNGNEHAMRGNVHPQQKHFSAGRNSMPPQQDSMSAWRGEKWNTSRWSKFPGRRLHRNFGHKREFGYSQKYSHQNFPGQRFSSRSHVYRGGAFHRGPPNKRFVSIEAEQNFHCIYQDQAFEADSPSVPLEKPWGFDQEGYYKEESGNYSLPPGDFSEAARYSRQADN